MKKISKVATAGVLLFALANPLGAFAENNVENISTTSSNKLTQDITVSSEEVNGEIVFHVSALRDTYDTIVYATINGKNYTYNLGNLKKGQVSRVVQPDASVNKQKAVISKESSSEKSLPNTSVVRELVEKTVLYSAELNGNVIEAKVVYKAYDLVEKNSNTVEEKKSITENKVKDGAIVKPEVLEIPEYKEILGGAIVAPEIQPELPRAEVPTEVTPRVEEPAAGTTPKAEESTATTPKAEESTVTTPKTEEPAAGTTPKAEESAATTNPKAEESAATTNPKAEESAAGTTPKAEESVAGTTPKAEEPVAGTTPKAEESAATTNPKAEESAATTNPKVEESTVATTPKAEEPAATTNPKVEESAAGTTPKAEESVAGTTLKAEEPAAVTTPKAEEPAAGTTPKAEESVAGTTPKAEEPAAVTTPKAEEPAAGATPKAEEPATTPKVEEPAAGTTPKVEEPAAGTTPKAEESAATTNPKAENPTEEVAPKDEKIEEAKKDGKDIIEKISSSKLSEIEKVKDEVEKTKLKEKLNELKDAALKAINNAKDHDAAVEAADDYQTKIDGINVPGEELPAPNFDKNNLTNGRNEGTTIDNGSTVIGHASGEATAVTQPEGASASTGAASQPKAATASTGTATQPEAATESPASTQPATEPTSDSTSIEKPQPVVTSETVTSGTSSFRNAPEVQVRAKRVAREVNQPDGTVNISYNYDGMPDINGFLSDPGENNTVAISNSATEDEVKELVKAKIQAKAQELAKYGYKVKEEIVFEQDTIVKNFNYVVTFTKEKTGTTGFRIAPEVQVRAKKVVKRDLSNKTKQINIYYNLTALKDIAGALGEVGENNMLTLSGNATKEEIKKAIEEHTKSQIEKLNKQGFKVTSTTDLDKIVEESDSYDYVVEFTKEAKTQSAGNTDFRKAPATQRRAKRSTEVQENVNVNIYFNLKTLPGIAGALDVDGDTTIKLPKNATVEQVKAAIQTKIAKVKKRGYKVNDAYFGARTEQGYDFVVEFTK